MKKIKLFFLNFLNQFYVGFKPFQFKGPCITFFGSSRIQFDNKYYIAAREIARELASNNFSIITEAGDGIMEAANRGASEVFGDSIGCNSTSKYKQKINPFVDKYIQIKFSLRKDFLIKYSYGFIFFPGDSGTLDFFYRLIELLQTKKVKNFPVILFGTYFFSDLLKKMTDDEIAFFEMSKYFFITDDTQEAVNYLINNVKENN